MKVSLLASGSSGNSMYIQEGATQVLVDAGLPGKQIEERLRSIDVDIGSLQGIVVSHEHLDHVQGVGVLARRLGVPAWMTGATLEGCRNLFRGSERVREFDNDEAFSIGDLLFNPFVQSHDAADPVGFVVSAGDSRLGIATDMGVVTQLVYQLLRGADLVVMEANYDWNMLMDGPYPWELKLRISGNRGHLANDRAAEALCRLAEEGLGRAVLAHLSDKNNRPDLAEAACRRGLDESGARGIRLTVAGRDRPTPMYVI